MGFFDSKSDSSAATQGQAGTSATDGKGAMAPVITVQDNRQSAGKYGKNIGGTTLHVNTTATDHGAIEAGLAAMLSAGDLAGKAVDTGRYAIDYAERLGGDALDLSERLSVGVFDYGEQMTSLALQASSDARDDYSENISQALNSTQQFAERAIAGDTERMAELMKYLVAGVAVLGVAWAWSAKR